MRHQFSFGQAQTTAEINTSLRFVVENSGDYNKRMHEEWAHKKAKPRALIGQAGIALIMYEQQVAATGIVYIHPDYTGLTAGIIEQKFVRTADTFKDRGLATLLMRTCVGIGAEMLNATPGAPLTLELDTREGTDAANFFRHAGFEEVGQAPLYEQERMDVLFRKFTHAPLSQL